MNVLAVIGPTALYLLYLWLSSIIVSSDLSDRKGYGEKSGLASGLLLGPMGVVVWLFFPPRPGSLWSRHVKIPDLLMAVAALVLLLSLFLPWYTGGSNFFEELKFYDLLVSIGAAIGFGQLHARAGAKHVDGLEGIALGAGAIAVLGTIVALLTPPDGVSIRWAAYLTLAMAVVMTVAAALAARAERSQPEGAATVAEARRLGVEGS